MTRNQTIAVFAGLALLGYLFFSGPFMNLFSNQEVNQGTNQNTPMPETGYSANDTTVGEGEIAEPGDKLTVHYVGTLQNGQVFDSSRDSNTPFTFTLGAGGVIRGWDEGMQGMREGGMRTLIIAPDYAYGAQGVGPIPPNATLIFEVELLSVEKAEVSN
ncbi:MAG: FKBP-type peptidyl-prolyl cis-trans isomerase [Candidatus Zambryskibacteria bacterium]|nr:FKBP-type peptidyl-prolyl cis-trans isomerase [Candidatus Zambryskibacteria bacterium]